MLATLRNWWRSFDRAGRELMNYSNPVLGSHKQEQKFLAEAKRQQEEKGIRHDG